MDPTQFHAMRRAIQRSASDRKVALYIAARGLSQAQYRELLQHFPIDALDILDNMFSE